MKTKFKWQKEYLVAINRLTNAELFNTILEFKWRCYTDRRDDFKDEVLVALFRKRMGLPLN